MTKILAIGNSFSEDATAYLHDIAAADGVNVKVVNLYIGGCSLKTHCENIEKDAQAYDYQLNGAASSKKISIKEALRGEVWDYVTLQQASHDSGILETYIPYFSRLSDYVKTHSPAAKQMLHQTWAYAENSDHAAFPLYDCSQIKMYQALTKAYQAISEESGLALLPTGELIQLLRQTHRFDLPDGSIALMRDGFHLSYCYGRYAAAALWYTILMGGQPEDNSFVPPSAADEPVSMEILELIRRTIGSMK